MRDLNFILSLEKILITLFFWLVLSNSMKVFVNWALCQMNVGFYESKGSNGNYNHNMPQHLLKEEFVDLQNLLKKIYLLPTVKKKRVIFFFYCGGGGGGGMRGG